MKIRIAVCDDINKQVESVSSLLEQYSSEHPGTELDIYGFNTETALLDSIEAGSRYGIYILDIIMPGIGGIELARRIKMYDTGASVIFLTNSKDFALDAFGVSAVQYFLKPLTGDVLFPVLDTILSMRRHEEEKFILISASDGRMIKLNYSLIIAVERIGRIIRYHLESGETLDSKTIRCPFRESVGQLFDDKRFLHVHQSFIANMMHVNELRTGSFLMKNGIEISIPRPKYTAIKNTYFKYLAETGVRPVERYNDDDNRKPDSK